MVSGSIMKFIRTAGVYAWHAVICASVLAVLFAMFLSALYGISVHRCRRAERFLQYFATLPTHLDNQTLQRFANHSGGTLNCGDDSCVYNHKEGFGFSSNGPFRPFRRTEWDYVAIRPWQIAVQLKTKNGELANSTFDFFVGRGRGWLYSETPLSGSMWAWLAISIRKSSQGFTEIAHLAKDRLRLQRWADGPGILIQKPNLTIDGSGEMLIVHLSPDAPRESKDIAFDLNIRCATSMSPCTEQCQLSPSAWQSYRQFQKSQGWYVEEPGVCPQLNRSSTNVR
jgi:hypothetical protein